MMDEGVIPSELQMLPANQCYASLSLPSALKLTTPCIIPYQTQTTMADLIQQLISDECIKLQEGSILQGFMEEFAVPPLKRLSEIREEIGAGRSLQLQIRIVKEILIDTNQFAAYCQKRKRVGMALTMELCFQFPQFHLTLYSRQPSHCPMQEIFPEFIHTQSEIFKQFVSNITAHPYQLYSINGPLSLSLPLYQHLSDKSIVYVKFPDVTLEERKEISLKKYAIHGREGQINGNWNDIKLMKVQTLLQQYKIQKYEYYGLKIFDYVLKPYDLFSMAEKHSLFKKCTMVNAIILTETHLFFYYAPTIRSLKKFNTSQIQLSETKHAQCRKIADQRINSVPSQQYKSQQFINPIIYYTSPHCYNQLNAFLRENNFSQQRKDDWWKWEYRFAAALIDCLHKLPIYEGLVYRGVSHRDLYKEGDVVCFKGFTSTSLKIENAKAFASKTLYYIHTLSGRNISLFSYYSKQAEILLFPYTTFVVTQVNREERLHVVKMLELPTPKLLNSTTLIWVDDNAKEGAAVWQSIEHKSEGVQLVQLLSNDHLTQWLKEHMHAISSPQVDKILITDLRRGEQPAAGIQTIKIMRQICKDIQIFIYVTNLSGAYQTMKQHKIPMDNIKIGNKRDQLIAWIHQSSKCIKRQCTII